MATNQTWRRHTQIAKSPPADLFMLKDKDRIYKPDYEIMCSSILQHLLSDPSNCLPAKYNSLLLHIIDDHGRLKDENERMRRRLEYGAAFNQVGHNDSWQYDCSLSRQKEARRIKSMPSNSLLCTEPKGANGLIRVSINNTDIAPPLSESNCSVAVEAETDTKMPRHKDKRKPQERVNGARLTANSSQESPFTILFTTHKQPH